MTAYSYYLFFAWLSLLGASILIAYSFKLAIYFLISSKGSLILKSFLNTSLAILTIAFLGCLASCCSSGGGTSSKILVFLIILSISYWRLRIRDTSCTVYFFTSYIIYLSISGDVYIIIFSCFFIRFIIFVPSFFSSSYYCFKLLHSLLYYSNILSESSIFLVRYSLPSRVSSLSRNLSSIFLISYSPLANIFPILSITFFKLVSCMRTS